MFVCLFCKPVYDTMLLRTFSVLGILSIYSRIYLLNLFHTIWPLPIQESPSYMSFHKFCVEKWSAIYKNKSLSSYSKIFNFRVKNQELMLQAPSYCCVLPSVLAHVKGLAVYYSVCFPSTLPAGLALLCPKPFGSTSPAAGFTLMVFLKDFFLSYASYSSLITSMNSLTLSPIAFGNVYSFVFNHYLFNYLFNISF